jgi:low affinity Fe/Cu permease
MKALARAWTAVAVYAAHPLAPILSAALLAVLWATAGLDVTNFMISIISLLLLFVLQSSQTADTLAIQVKLDELVRAMPEADDRFRHIDERTADEIREIRE